MIQFSLILSAVRHVAEQCRNDLDTRCEGVEIGGGQVYQCLSKNRADLDQKCTVAFSQAEEDLE